MSICGKGEKCRRGADFPCFGEKEDGKKMGRFFEITVV
jgi:hypothetical protein